MENLRKIVKSGQNSLNYGSKSNIFYPDKSTTKNVTLQNRQCQDQIFLEMIPNWWKESNICGGSVRICSKCLDWLNPNWAISSGPLCGLSIYKQFECETSLSLSLRKQYWHLQLVEAG